MKKLLLVALVAVMGMMMSSCGKDVDLANTSWKFDRTGQMEVQGVEMDVHINFTLHFIDGSKGEDEALMEALYNGAVVFSDGPTTQSFTYTFDGEKGVITHIYDEDGETVTEQDDFTYDKKNDVILLYIEGIEEIGFENPCQFSRI